MNIFRLFVLAAFVCVASLETARAESVPLWSIEHGFAFTAPVQPIVAVSRASAAIAPAASSKPANFSPVQLLTDLANKLRGTRYKRGGRQPSTGFDCSGFVRYVFHLGIGVDLPRTSAAQFQAGHQVARNDLRSGDLVFFRTAGKRISHVGIYLDGGRFIHSPSSGKRVSVSSLSEHYWSRHFAGGRRAEVLAAHMIDPVGDATASTAPGA